MNIKKCRRNASNCCFWLVACVFTCIMINNIQVTNVGAFSKFEKGEKHYLNISLMRSWLFTQNEFDIIQKTIDTWSRDRIFSDMLNFSLSQETTTNREKMGHSYISPLNLESAFGMGEYGFIYNTDLFDSDEHQNVIISDEYNANNFYSSGMVDAEIRIKNYTMGFIVNTNYIKSKLNFNVLDEVDRKDGDVHKNKIKLESSGFTSQAYFFNDLKASNSFYLSAILMGGNSYPRSTFYENLKLADTSKVFGYQLQMAYMRSGLLEKNDIRLGLIAYIQGMYNYRDNNLNIDENLLNDVVDKKYYLSSMDSDRLAAGGTVILMMNKYFARGRLYLLAHASINRLLKDSLKYQTGDGEIMKYGEGIGLKNDPYTNSLSVGIDIGLMTFSNWDLILRSTLYFGHGGVKGSFGLGVKIII